MFIELFERRTAGTVLRPLNIVVAPLTLFMAGCAGQASTWQGALEDESVARGTSRCRAILSYVPRAVAIHDVGDAEARRISGFPHLRINRFLAHVGQRYRRTPSGSAFRAWVARLRRLDQQAVHIELANLPPASMRRLGAALFGHPVTAGKIARSYEKCAVAAVSRRLATKANRQRLVKTAYVADDYSDVAQTAGLFPLTSIPIAEGWKQWKAKHLSSFERPIQEQPVRGQLIEWWPRQTSGSALTPNQVRRILERSRDPALGIPEPNNRDRNRLFATFAPIWQVDVGGQYDRIGHPAWHNDRRSIAIDHRRPTVFTRISHAIVDGKILLQLNYSVWFDERPRAGPLDLLGGKLDGIVWRVTLSTHGKPMIYDSIHACGCYHFLFPVMNGTLSRWRRTRSDLKEVPVVLHHLRAPQTRQRVLLRLASASHYLQGVSVVTVQSASRSRLPYRLIDDRALQTLPLPKRGRRSLFRSDGLVADTERLERFLLWPTGVRSPGAMRQWGHHAIAFAERRHFDDPVLFDQIFMK